MNFSHLGIGDHRTACPECNRSKRDTALSVTVEPDGGVFHCFRCGWAGAWKREGLTENRRPKAPPPKSDTPLRWSERAEAIWKRTTPLRGTIGEVYLRTRHCILPPADSDLRFMPGSDAFPPSLVGRITDFVTGEPLSLHFTRLKADGSGKAGTDRDRLMLAGHAKKGGVIRLWPDEAVTLSVAIGEGIETCLAAARFHTPVWCAIDAGNLGGLPVVSGIESLVVFADRDPAGVQAATELCLRWRLAGRVAMAMAPVEAGHDINDEVAA